MSEYLPIGGPKIQDIFHRNMRSSTQPIVKAVEEAKDMSDIPPRPENFVGYTGNDKPQAVIEVPQTEP